MGVLYTVMPLDDAIAQYLHDTGGIVPLTERPTRQPTPREVRTACDSLSGQRVRYNVNPGTFWQALVEGVGDHEQGPGILLNIEEFRGSKGQPHSIWFEKEWSSLILDIAARVEPCDNIETGLGAFPPPRLCIRQPR